MDDQQQSRWRPNRKQLLWAGGFATLVAFLLIVICGYLFGWEWTGLPKRTLWDWLQLLIIPAVLAGVGFWFNRQQREQEVQTADSRAQDEALQAYLDQMSEMLIPPSKDIPSLYKARPGDSLSSVARARTLTVLPRLNGDHKARVVQFLYEAGLIPRKLPRLVRPNLVLIKADLSGADLSGAFLNYADLSKADLSKANLSRTLLGGTDLSKANLSRADLSNAIVSNYADLSKADMSGADLSGAFLRYANLEGARGATDDQLAQAYSLEGATMPDGQVLKGDDNPNGPTLDDWLKSKDSGEHGEISSSS